MNTNDDESISVELQEKLNRLKDYLRELGSLAVGFSGGVDSSFLLAVAAETLGDKAMAVTGVDASVPQREVDEATAFCKDRGPITSGAPTAGNTGLRLRHHTGNGDTSPKPADLTALTVPPGAKLLSSGSMPWPVYLSLRVAAGVIRNRTK